MNWRGRDVSRSVSPVLRLLQPASQSIHLFCGVISCTMYCRQACSSTAIVKVQNVLFAAATPTIQEKTATSQEHLLTLLLLTLQPECAMADTSSITALLGEDIFLRNTRTKLVLSEPCANCVSQQTTRSVQCYSMFLGELCPCFQLM